MKHVIQIVRTVVVLMVLGSAMEYAMLVTLSIKELEYVTPKLNLQVATLIVPPRVSAPE